MKSRNRSKRYSVSAQIRDQKLIAEESFRKRLEIKEDINSDTYIRKELHKLIEQDIKEGKSKEEIIKDLSIERYSKYNMYFENWINDKSKKIKPEKQIEER